jgi:hypothetical protein
MNGYVKNMTHLWAHTMKRTIGPGSTVPLNELYEQYGEKHGLEDGEEFINWLRNVKLRDSSKWQIFKEDDTVYEEEVNISINKPNTEKFKEYVPPVVSTTDMSVEGLVELSVRKAREIVPKISDVQLLKYAENIAKQRANKDSLRLILLRRIKELSHSTMR